MHWPQQAGALRLLDFLWRIQLENCEWFDAAPILYGTFGCEISNLAIMWKRLPQDVGIQQNKTKSP